MWEHISHYITTCSLIIDSEYLLCKITGATQEKNGNVWGIHPFKYVVQVECCSRFHIHVWYYDNVTVTPQCHGLPATRPLINQLVEVNIEWKIASHYRSFMASYQRRPVVSLSKRTAFPLHQITSTNIKPLIYDFKILIQVSNERSLLIYDIV